MKSLPNSLAVLTAVIVHITLGSAAMSIGRIHLRALSNTDSELPLISEASAAYTATSAPMLVGLFLGIVTLIGLRLVLRSKRFDRLLPLLLSLSFVVAILHIMFVVIGTTIPLVLIGSAMSE